MDDIDRPTCLDCGYVLEGLDQNRCPECGRTFDPDDSLTFGCPTTYMAQVKLWLARTRGVINCILVWFVVFFVLPSRGGFREFADDFFNWLRVHSGLAILGAYLYCIYMAAARVRGRAYAVGHVALLLVLAPIIGIGFFLVPALIEGDAARLFKVDASPPPSIRSPRDDP